MAADSLELRIITGFHAGGASSLHGDESVSLGSDPDNDLVLRDAPFVSAQLTWQDGTLVWRDAHGEFALSCPHLIRAGGLSLLICTASRAWDEPADDLPVLSIADGSSKASRPSPAAELAPDDDAPELTPAPGTGTGDIASDPTLADALRGASEQSAEHSADASGSSPSSAPETTPGPRMRWAVLALLAVAALGLLMTRIDLGPASKSADSVSPDPADAAQATLDPAILTVVRSHIAAARLDPQVRAAIVGNRIRLTGVVESDEAMEALLRRISGSTQQIDLDLLTQGEFAVRVREMSATLPGDVSAAAAGIGQILLEGTVESTGERTQLLAMAQRLVPHASAVRSRLLTRAERALIAAERQGQPLPPAASPTPGVAPAPTAPRLPPMAAVVSGESGYLILRDGSRVLPGGMMQGMRLERIGETELIVTDTRGQRFRIAR